MADARKYAQQTTSMQDGMVDDSKKLLDMFGIPYVIRTRLFRGYEG